MVWRMNVNHIAPGDEVRVSIVVINHDYREFLEEAVASALRQTCPAEVVVVDDGSTDGSVALIQGFGSRVVPVLKSAGGHASAANAGFAASTGDLVIFLDADDRLHQNCVAEVVGAWRPGLAKLQYRLATIDRQGRDRQMQFPYYPPDLTPDILRQQALRTGFYAWPVSSGNAFARAFLSEVMPIKTTFNSPDGYLSKMAPLFGDIGILRAVLADYRVHGRNSWAQDGFQGLRRSAISRAVRSDQAFQNEFAERAAALGYRVPSYRSCLHVQALEYRMLSLRLAPHSHPVENDRRWHLLGLGLRAARSAVNVSPVGRLLWAAWFITMASLPAAWLNRVYAGFRGQLQRPAWSRWLVAQARGQAFVSSAP